MKHRNAWASTALIFAVSSAAVAQPSYRPVVLPVDTVLRVRLNDTLSTTSSRAGDHFTATVTDPSLPDGTLVRGVVIGVKRAQSGTPARLGVDFQSLEMPGGQEIPISGTATGLDSSSVRTTSNGRLVAKSHGSSSLGKYIGYGALGGLLAGSLLGSNVVGGLVGAGAGYAVGKNKSKNSNIVLKQGTKLGVRLDRPVTLTGA
jgi:hypothetical protein